MSVFDGCYVLLRVKTTHELLCSRLFGVQRFGVLRGGYSGVGTGICPCLFVDIHTVRYVVYKSANKDEIVFYDG